MYIIDKNGLIIYNGAIDDDLWGNTDGEVINYVDLGLNEVIDGKNISANQTKPYGCSVKYKK